MAKKATQEQIAEIEQHKQAALTAIARLTEIVGSKRDHWEDSVFAYVQEPPTRSTGLPVQRVCLV